ncbi:hypothetical protein D3C76_1676850 [compost metagenome]
MQQFRTALAVQHLVVAGKHRQAAIAIFLAEVFDTLGGDVTVLFRPVDFALHMLFRIQIGVEDHLSDAAQKADTFGPKAPQTHPTDQRMFIPFLLNRLVHLFQ